MNLFSMEGGESAYRADFWVYGAAVPLLLVLLITAGPRGHWLLWLGCAGLGLASWSLVEYLLHRFVLHRVQPFQRWHGEHHRRPAALIGTPTLLSAALFGLLVFAPAWAIAGPWPACALTLGMVAGYLAYAVTHHAAHHAAPPGLAGTAWLRQRRRWHALHHQRSGAPGCYGVTSGLWDRLFDSVLPPAIGVRS
jgi:sterol desaturase/sphingolipid hydroxylase (fatty acid hydroxylase superfamily)